jgi:hypothetical protein
MFRNRRFVWVLLVISLLIAAAAVAYPMYVIRPFRAQGAAELAAALHVRRWGPPVAAVAAAVAVACFVLIRRSSSARVPRIAAYTMAGLTAAFAAISHINIFELMFHRVDDPAAIAASEAKLDADDMVLSVRLGGESRAYPVRMMAYHHIVNDVVGGVPVVATY